jgi:hypothetical protein
MLVPNVKLDNNIAFMHNNTMKEVRRRCKPVEHKPRHRATLAIDGELWERFQPVLRDSWLGSFTSWLEYAMECYTRESCDGCPYEEEEGQEKADGIGKVIDKAGQ